MYGLTIPEILEREEFIFLSFLHFDANGVFIFVFSKFYDMSWQMIPIVDAKSWKDFFYFPIHNKLGISIGIINAKEI